jgi:hypothetical protein
MCSHHAHEIGQQRRRGELSRTLHQLLHYFGCSVLPRLLHRSWLLGCAAPHDLPPVGYPVRLWRDPWLYHIAFLIPVKDEQVEVWVKPATQTAPVEAECETISDLLQVSLHREQPGVSQDDLFLFLERRGWSLETASAILSSLNRDGSLHQGEVKRTPVFRKRGWWRLEPGWNQRKLPG